MNRKQSVRRTGILILWFTALYALCMGLRVWYFARAGKSMICEADALEQHINALMAYGKWMRGLIYTLLREHRLAFESYSFGIGLGADFYTGMQYYVVGEPLNLPVAFLPTGAVYYYYQLLILVRPYLAGLSFLALCFWRNREEVRGHFADEPLSPCGMLGGALLYSFSGTVLFIGMWNPFFVIPMITLPLLILTLDLLLVKNRCAPFVLAVFLAGVSNFYFFYIQVLLLFGYFALRLVLDRPAGRAPGNPLPRRHPGKAAPVSSSPLTQGHLGKASSVSVSPSAPELPGSMSMPRPFSPGGAILRFLLSGALGVCMAGILLLPMFFALLGNPRSGGHALALLYEADYYRELLRNLVTYVYHPLHDTELCLTVWAPLLYIGLFVPATSGKGRLKRERAELLILAAMLVFPVFGYILSGFSYAINRWCFAVALYTGWLFVREYPAWSGFLRKALCGLIPAKTGAQAEAETGKAALLSGTIPALVAGESVGPGEAAKPAGVTLQKPHLLPDLALLLPVLVCILLSVVLADAPEHGDLPNGYVERMTGQEFQDRMLLTEVNALKQTVIPSESAHTRYAARSPVWNASLLHGISSTQFYWSLANGAVAELFSDLAVNDMANYCYLGFDDRAMLTDLAGVTHYTLRFDTEEEARYVPAGFERTADYYNFAIYESPYPVGMGTVYDRTLSRAEWEALSPWDREEAMMTAAVLDDGDLRSAASSGIPQTTPDNLSLTGEVHDLLSAPQEGTDGSYEGGRTGDRAGFSICPQEGVSLEPGDDGKGVRFIVTGEDGGVVWLNLPGASGEADDDGPRETGLFLGGLSVDGPRDIVNIEVRAFSDTGTSESREDPQMTFPQDEENSPQPPLPQDDADSPQPPLPQDDAESPQTSPPQDESDSQQAPLPQDDADSPQPPLPQIDPEEAAIVRTVSFKTPESEFYSGWHDYYINLGSAAGPFAWACVRFPAAGVYAVRELSVVTRSVGESFDAARETLTSHGVQEVDIRKNPVSLMTDTVTMTAGTQEGEAGILMLTIPWQRGWKALVDGEEAELFRVNTAFTGLLLAPGFHEITLHYHTPGLLAGLLFTLAGFAVFLGLLRREKDRHE